MNINPFIDLIVTILGLYETVLIVSIVASWLIAFNLINTRNRFISMVMQVLYGLTEPVLRKVRKFMPNLGVIDISPIVVFLAIRFTINALHTYLYTY